MDVVAEMEVIYLRRFNEAVEYAKWLRRNSKTALKNQPPEIQDAYRAMSAFKKVKPSTAKVIDFKEYLKRRTA